MGKAGRGEDLGESEKGGEEKLQSLVTQNGYVHRLNGGMIDSTCTDRVVVFFYGLEVG